MIPRKLIRPSLKNVMGTKKDEQSKTYKAKASLKTDDSILEVLPPERTNREADYYQELIKNKTLLIVLLKDGKKIEGHLEYYDKNFLRITIENQPNAFIYKTDIKYFTEA